MVTRERDDAGRGVAPDPERKDRARPVGLRRSAVRRDVRGFGSDVEAIKLATTGTTVENGLVPSDYFTMFVSPL